SDRSPRVYRETHFQIRWSINVWAVLICTQILGPYFLPNKLTGSGYLEFLRNELPSLLENVLLATIRSMTFQHEDAPSHCMREVKNFLNQTYLCWTARDGKVTLTTKASGTHASNITHLLILH
ncbi:hypothetical protein WN51_00054, partial [Melipona quadrifasciata]